MFQLRRTSFICIVKYKVHSSIQQRKVAITQGQNTQTLYCEKDLLTVYVFLRADRLDGGYTWNGQKNLF